MQTQGQYQKAAVTPFRKSRGGSSTKFSTLSTLVSFLSSMLCFLIDFLISLVLEMIPIKRSILLP